MYRAKYHLWYRDMKLIEKYDIAQPLPQLLVTTYGCKARQILKSAPSLQCTPHDPFTQHSTQLWAILTLPEAKGGGGGFRPLTFGRLTGQKFVYITYCVFRWLLVSICGQHNFINVGTKILQAPLQGEFEITFWLFKKKSLFWPLHHSKSPQIIMW